MLGYDFEIIYNKWKLNFVADALSTNNEKVEAFISAISIESRPIKGKYLQKAIYKKEMLAILHALNIWRPYLMGRHFKVKIDHDSIKKKLE